MQTKKLFPILFLAILSMVVWQGCTKTDVQKGSIEFGMNTLAEDWFLCMLRIGAHPFPIVFHFQMKQVSILFDTIHHTQ